MIDKVEYFLRALAARACVKREWINQVFSVVVATPAVEADYPYRIVTQPDSPLLFFKDPDSGELTAIYGSDKTVQLYAFDEPVVIPPGRMPNYTAPNPLHTTYGRAFVNYLCLVLPFQDALPYVNGYFNIQAIENRLAEMLIDDPADEADWTPPPGKVYVKQLLRFNEYALSLTACNNIAVTSVSRKALVAHPKGREYRQQLVEQYKDRLNDPAVVARIGKELEQLDRTWLADDPTSKYYATSDKKLFGAVRKKMFYMFGAESPFQDGTTVEFIEKSLEEGIDVNHLPAMINSLRYGSFNRGAQTQLGGESTKTIYRMLGTVRIAEVDCGSTLGIPLDINPANKKQFVGLTAVDKGKSVLLTPENIDSFVGRQPAIRGPLTCKTAGRNVCAVCIGKDLAEQPEGLAAAAAGLGGRFLSLFLKKMHGGALSTERWELGKRIG